MPNIVISYRREDSKWTADRIFDRLEAHYGKDNVFMDIDSIPFGIDFRDHIRETLERCDVMVALIGPNWVGRDSTGDHILRETDWVRIEIESALNKKIPLIPLLIDGSQMPNPAELPDTVKGIVFRQSAALDRDNFRSQMDKLIASIDLHLAKLHQTPPAPTPAPPRPLQETEQPVRRPSPHGAQPGKVTTEAEVKTEQASESVKPADSPTFDPKTLLFVFVPLAAVILVLTIFLSR